MAKDRSEKAPREPKTIALALKRLNALKPGLKYRIGIVCHEQEDVRDRILTALENAADAADIQLRPCINTLEIMDEVDALRGDVRDVVAFIILPNYAYALPNPNLYDDGAEFASELRTDYGEPDIPVLVMADEITEKLRDALDRGIVDGTIAEGFTRARDLIAAVVRAINHRYDILTQTKNE